MFTDNPETSETKLVQRELTRRGVSVDNKAPWDLQIPDLPALDYNAVYVPSNMLHRGSTYELVNRLTLLRELDSASPIVNPLEGMLYYSKGELTLKLKELGLPHPRTLVTENVERAYYFAKELIDSGKEVVLKPLCGARGVGVTKLSEIRSREDLLQFLVWYNRDHAQGVFYLQEFVPNHGYDVRCLVVDGEVVGRERRLNNNDFRYNVAVGGTAEAYNDSVYDQLAIKVTRAVGLCVAGVDVLPGQDGTPYILEANCYPGYKALIDATGIPIHAKIAEFLLHCAKK